MADVVNGAVVATKRKGTGVQPQIYKGVLSLVSMYKGDNDDEFGMNWNYPSFKGKPSDRVIPTKVELGPVDGEYAMDRLKVLFKECSALIKEYEANKDGGDDKAPF